MATMSDNVLPAAEAGPTARPVLRALRQQRGRVTVGDVVAATGMPRDEAESTLKSLLETRRGHLEVGETGTLVYRFDPKLLQRDAESLWARIRERSWALFTQAFKVWIVLMLVVYFVVFVALLIAALVASESRGGGRGGGRRRYGGRRGGFGGFPSFWIWYMFWSPGWGWGWRRPYYGHRWEQRYASGGSKPKVPFIMKVFAFVFGPDRPRPSQRQKDRSVIRLIRSRRGVLTAAELVQHTGLPLHEAEEEMARLMGAYDGDVKVVGEGVLTYVFPELMLSAEGRVTETEPDPAWRRLEPDLSVTGNEAKSNAIVGGINGFNLVAAATAPLYIFPRLGLGGLWAWIGLVWVPLVFSALFFAIPAVRYFLVNRANERRRRRNLRKVILGYAFQASLNSRGAQWVTVAGTREHVRGAFPKGVPAGSGPGKGAGSVEGELQSLLAEFDGEVEEGAEGTVRYRFPLVRTQFEGSEVLRNRLRLEGQTVGEIVYSSDQTEAEANERELEAFDREMERQTELERYAQNPGRVDYLDDFELVAFDEELKRGRAAA